VAIVGWGQTSQGGPAGVKHWGESVVGAVSDYEFQVGPAQDDVRQCHGDSGGPTFLAVETGSSNKERVVGVTSHSWDATDCASVGGVETRVDYYLDWIEDQMSDACADGTRTWCDEPGILPPPTGARTTSANIGDGIRVAPICGTVVPGSGAVVVALSMLLVGARRSRTQERARRR
jgi:secreted trypsin-like serine protease